jgi:hypothetical protein
VLLRAYCLPRGDEVVGTGYPFGPMGFVPLWGPFVVVVGKPFGPIGLNG